MNDAYYQQILTQAIGKMTALAATRDEIEVQLIKLRELIHATANMLSDERQKTKYLQVLNNAIERSGLRDSSLTDAIRRVLQDTRNHYLTVSQVRDRLETYGFDFNSYTCNPLASISTTMRRMKELDSKKIEGVAAYRMKDVYASGMRPLPDVEEG